VTGGDVMIDTAALRGIIAEKGFSQRAIAQKLGMTDKTFYSKMNKKKFDSDEMNAMVRILEIKNPSEIFFARKVT
jgi:hypothetical protein